MSTNDSSPEKAPASRLALIVPLATLLVGLALGYAVVAWNKNATISIDSSGVKFDVAADAKFSDLLDQSLQADGTSVEAILVSRGFYRPTSEQLVTVLSTIDASTPEGKRVSQSLRRMLWDLKGPFKRPGTLSGADARLVEALDEIASVPEGAEEASKLFAALWKNQIEQTGIFRQRRFRATVRTGTLGAPSGASVVYACPGSAIVDGRVIQLFKEGLPGQLVTEVKNDPAVFPCGDDPVTPRQLLAGKPVRLAMNEAAFHRLYGDEAASAQTPATVDFVVYPRNLAPRGNWEN